MSFLLTASFLFTIAGAQNHGCIFDAGCTKANPCYPGLKCVQQWFGGQCSEDPQYIFDPQAPTTKCVVTETGYGCTKNSDCCNPYAICINDWVDNTGKKWFKQCAMACMFYPTFNPTSPTLTPTQEPTVPTIKPSFRPTKPTVEPSFKPSHAPSQPTARPTSLPTLIPTFKPTHIPTIAPSAEPTTPLPQVLGLKQNTFVTIAASVGSAILVLFICFIRYFVCKTRTDDAEKFQYDTFSPQKLADMSTGSLPDKNVSPEKSNIEMSKYREHYTQNENGPSSKFLLDSNAFMG